MTQARWPVGLRLGWGLLIASVALSPVAQAAPVTYTLLPEQSFVQFEVMHFGTSTSRGRFGPLQGEVTLDREKRQGEVALRIDTAGVDTGLRIFNARLRDADLLATAQFPEAYFVARNFVFDGDRVAEVRGEFTLRGVSQGLSLKALRFGCRADPITRDKPGEICGGDFEGEVKRSDFGATFGLPLVGDRVRLVVQVEGRR
jgi:polyisoprenoid-binding protein YceI